MIKLSEIKKYSQIIQHNKQQILMFHKIPRNISAQMVVKKYLCVCSPVNNFFEKENTN